MSQPRFSIVIPTRDRARTLPFTVQTCLAQDFGDFEIVVSDNCSSEPASETLADFSDTRIKHVRTPRLLAMTDSWDYALAQASGEFVTVVGADDGLLLHALAEIDRLMRLLDTKILRWETVCYNWPDLPEQEHARPNALLIPLRQADDYYPIRRRDSATLIEAAAHSCISYTELPMVQCAMIHRDWIERLRTRTGRVFRSPCPDIYSSFAFAALAGSFYSVAAPMTINGLSGQSNGVACIYLKEQSPIAQEFRNLNYQGDHLRHSQVPDLPVMPAYVANSFLCAQAAVPCEMLSIPLDRRELARHCIHEARFKDEADWTRSRTAIRQSLADDETLVAWFDCEYGAQPLADLVQQRHRLKRYGGSYLNLDASEFGVTNIFEAAQLCEKLLGCKRDGLNCHVAPEPTSCPTSVTSSSIQGPHWTGFWQRLRKATQTMIYG